MMMMVEPRHLRGLMIVAVLYACMANHVLNATGNEGSAAGEAVSDNEDDFCVKVVRVTSTNFIIYWIEPDISIDRSVSYYQVSYSVAMCYQTAAGERMFNDNHTSDPLFSDFPTYKIPLYSANSTYVVQITAVIDDGSIITSTNYRISADKLEINMNQNDTMFFQFGLELTDPHASLNCPSFEDDYGNTLLLIRSQLIQATQNICKSIRNDSDTCATQLTSDHFSCHNNSRLVYVARVIGTTDINATTYLEYLNMLGSVEISLQNQTFSTISSPSCPLSIPSAKESNCINTTNSTTDTATIETTSATAIDVATTAIATAATTTTSITTTTTTTTATSITTTTTTTSSSTTTTTITAPVPTTATPTTDGDNNGTVVVIVTIACLTGIIIMTMSIICIIVICSRCSHYHDHGKSIDVEKNLFTATKPYSLITNPRSNSRPQLTDYERQWNLPAQSLILPSLSYHKEYLSSDQQHYSGHRSIIEHHHITTDH